MSYLLTQQLRMIVKSARVRRYHTEDTLHPQSVGEHTYGVMWLVFLLTDGACSRELLLAAMMHDATEYVTGDVPAPIKRRHGLKGVYTTLEDEVLSALQLPEPPLTANERSTLKLADNLEGALFCVTEARRGNRLIHLCLDNYIDYLEDEPLTGVALDILTHIKELYHETLFGK